MDSRSCRIGLVIACCVASCRSAPSASQFLYVWAGTGHAPHGSGVNFLAVLDANPQSQSYGQVLDVALADSGMMPHHSEFVLPKGRPLFVNDFMTGKTLLVSHLDPRAPKVSGQVQSVPGLRKTHSFARLHDSLVVATLQFGDSIEPGNPGGVALFDDAGRLIRFASAKDSAFPGAHIRPYGLALLPEIDRLVTTSSPMDSERTADVIQVWRLSDLTLLKTLPVPAVPGDSVERYPFELRTLADGRTVMLNSYYCGFYRITGVERANPSIELVHAMRTPVRIGCSVPVVLGRYWVMPIAYSHTIVTLDINDPVRPRVVAELPTDSTFYPHWLSADPASDRIVVTEQGDGPPRVMMLHLDTATGQLAWDERFRDRGSRLNGISFARTTWPRGIAGPAMPHAAVFVP